jgi:hypothetical protein
MSAGANTIWLRTFAYDTGICQRGSRLLPIELIDSVPHRADFIEGSLEFRIGETSILSNESVPCGYVEDWWSSGLTAITDLLSLRSTRWMLPGKVCFVRFDIVRGTRRVIVQTILPEHPSLSPAVQTHAPTLSDVMIEEAGRFFDWLRGMGRERIAERQQLAELRSAPAPWRR